jgi:hypothetical protein
MEKKFQPLSVLYEKIKTLNKNKATGTLFAVTKKNNSLQILFNEGEIEIITFKNEQGREALEKIALINGIQFKFMKDFIPKKKKVELPDTSEIISIIGKFVGNHENENDTKKDNPLFTEEQFDAVKNILIDYVGPMATLLCEEYCNTNYDINELIKKLAEEIPYEEQAIDFMEKCKKTLNL